MTRHPERIEGAPPIRPRRVGRRGLVAAIVWATLFVGARFLLDGDTLASELRLAIAIAPLPAFAWLLWEFVRKSADADELERRIQHEALAVAFSLTLLLMMTLGMLQLAMPLATNDWSYRHLWPYLFGFYVIGMIRARRRYE